MIFSNSLVFHTFIPTVLCEKVSNMKICTVWRSLFLFICKLLWIPRKGVTANFEVIIRLYLQEGNPVFWVLKCMTTGIFQLKQKRHELILLSSHISYFRVLGKMTLLCNSILKLRWMSDIQSSGALCIIVFAKLRYCSFISAMTLQTF